MHQGGSGPTPFCPAGLTFVQPNIQMCDYIDFGIQHPSLEKLFTSSVDKSIEGTKREGLAWMDVFVGSDCLHLCRRRVMLASQTRCMSPAWSNSKLFWLAIVCVLCALEDRRGLEEAGPLLVMCSTWSNSNNLYLPMFLHPLLWPSYHSFL